VTSVQYDDLSGVLTVSHEYPEGVNVAQYLRTLFREHRLGSPLELKVVRHEVGAGNGNTRCN